MCAKEQEMRWRVAVVHEGEEQVRLRVAVVHTGRGAGARKGAMPERGQVRGRGLAVHKREGQAC